MKMFKQFYLFVTLLFFTSCGFSPMLKNIDLNDIKINKIIYTGPNELTFYLKSNFGLPVNKEDKNAYTLKINLTENNSSITKDAAGKTTEEQIKIIINFQILEKNKKVGDGNVSDARTISITNNVSTDSETKRIERENIISNLIQKLRFSIRATISSSKNDN